MSRQIIKAKENMGIRDITATQDDPYVNKLLKLIPADVIALYLTVINLIKAYHRSDGGSNETLQWIAFGVITIITPFYLKFIAKIDSPLQIAFCVLSFCIWVFSMGGPIDGREVGGYSVQFIASLILPVYTLFIPFVYDKTVTN